MKKYRATTDKKPFIIRIGNLDMDLHTISDEQAEIMHKGGSKLVEPVPETKPKPRSK